MIQPGDVVEATLIDPETQNAVTQLFTVTEMTDTTYVGGQFAVDTEAGWAVRLSRKDPVNLALPSAISEIIAIDRSNRLVPLIGKGLVWRDERGQLFPVEDIFNWLPTELPEP
jgi:hypothetical protein